LMCITIVLGAGFLRTRPITYAFGRWQTLDRLAVSVKSKQQQAFGSGSGGVDLARR
jgi:hypothetical protein